MIPREPGCYILNHISSGTFYIGSTGDLRNRERNLMSSLNTRTNHNPRLQELYWDDPNVIFEYLITRDREEAYDVEQAELDKWLGHPNCLNVNNDARCVWRPGTMPQERIETLRLRNSQTHAGNKYCLGQERTDETKQRLSESIRRHWDSRGRVEKIERPPRYGARGRVVEGTVLENMRAAAVTRGIGHSRRVSIDGVIYHNATYAAEALGFSRRTIDVRIKDERYPTWVRVDP